MYSLLLHRSSQAKEDNLVGPTVTRPVQDSLAVLLLDNQLYILTNSLKEQVSFENTSKGRQPSSHKTGPGLSMGQTFLNFKFFNSGFAKALFMHSLSIFNNFLNTVMECVIWELIFNTLCLYEMDIRIILE